MINGAEYTAEEIEKITDGTLVGENVRVSALTINSKKVFPQACFFAIKGERVNGIDYVEEAIQNGAVLVVAEEKISAQVSVIYVKSVVKALGMLAKYHKKSTRVIGITGSTGKTTTKDMIIEVIKKKYSVCGTYENENNEIGVALTLLSIKDEDFCVVEMGMRGLGEIEWLSYIAEPYISVITNCGSAHIGRLGSAENVFRAKTEILCNTKKYAVLPDEKRFKDMKTELETVFVGRGGDLYAENVEFDEGKFCFDIKGTLHQCDGVRLNTIYLHNVTNALNAYAVGKLLGINDEAIKNALGGYGGKSLREEKTVIKGATVIVDCYNASFEGVKSAISSLSEYVKQENKKGIVVLGDMLELGDRAGELHRKIGELCKEKNISILFAAGEYAEYYMQGFGNGEPFDTVMQMAEAVYSCLDKECVVLIKASRKCKFEKIIEIMRARSNVH